MDAIRRWFVRAWFWLVSAAVLLIGIGGTLSSNDIVKGLSEALIVASFLALTVDQYLKRRFAEEIAGVVGRYLFTYDMPPELAEELLHVRELKLVRRELEILFRFRRREDGLLTLETDMDFMVVNYSDRPQPFDHLAVVLEEKYAHIEQSQIVGVSASGPDIPGGGYHHEGHNVPVTREDDPPKLIFKQTVIINPNRTAPDNRFWWRSRRIVAGEDQGVVYFPAPVGGVTVQVGEKPDDLRVEVIFPHRKEADATKIPGHAPNRWHLRATFLPWQSVTVIWRRQDLPGQLTASPRVSAST